MFPVPVSSPPSVVTPYITTAHQQIQESDIGTAHSTYSDFSSFTCVPLCMCIILCNFITCVASWNHHYGQDTELFHHHKAAVCHPFRATPALLPPFLTPGKHYNFVISRIFQNFVHHFTVCNLLKLAFSTQYNSLEICLSS